MASISSAPPDPLPVELQGSLNGFVPWNFEVTSVIPTEVSGQALIIALITRATCSRRNHRDPNFIIERNDSGSAPFALLQWYLKVEITPHYYAAR